MSMPTYSKPVIILEGPDGAGKTTLAHKLVDYFDARYVHLGPMTSVKDLGRIYVEAMLPAIQGYQPVVMDRAWYSEEPYGMVFREGKLRNDLVVDAMLERIVHACTGAVVYCQTDPKNLVASFVARKGQEYLDRADQVLDVARRYHQRMAHVSLPMVGYDYTHGLDDSIIHALNRNITLQSPHRVAWESAGNLQAPVLLVGEGFTDHQNHDTLLQRPFVSFVRNGSSYWVTRQLQTGGVGEDQLCWVNQDRGPRVISEMVSEMPNLRAVICLGAEAAKTVGQHLQGALGVMNVKIETLAHPQHHRRFKHHEPYPLIDIVKEHI